MRQYDGLRSEDDPYTDRSCRIFSKGDALPCIKTLQFQLERRCQSHTSFIFYAASGKDDKTTRTLHRYDVSVPKELTFMSIPGCIELKLDLHPDLSLHTCHNFILSGGSGSTCLLEIDDEIHPTHRKDVVNSRCLDSPAATSESENAKSESEGLSNIENAMQTQHTEGKHVIPRNPVANQDDLRVTTNGSMNEDGYESDVKKQCLSKPETRTSDAARSEEKGTRMSDAARSEEKRTRTSDAARSEEKGTRMSYAARSEEKRTRTSDAARSEEKGTRTSDAARSEEKGTTSRQSQTRQICPEYPSKTSKPPQDPEQQRRRKSGGRCLRCFGRH